MATDFALFSQIEQLSSIEEIRLPYRTVLKGDGANITVLKGDEANIFKISMVVTKRF